jgi:hypothetical protein
MRCRLFDEPLEKIQRCPNVTNQTTCNSGVKFSPPGRGYRHFSRNSAGNRRQIG